MAGEDFIIGLAVNLHPEIEASLSVEQMQEIIAWHDERGLMDYVTCGTGSYFDFTGIIPTVFFADKLGAPYAEALKAVAKHMPRCRPRATSARPRTPNMSWPRARPTWCRSCAGRSPIRISPTRRKEGRPEDIRPCLSCNQMCWGRRYRDYWISCLINPSAGREFEWGGDRFTPRRGSRSGCWWSAAAPAGLEAARVAAERGHQVTLVEASDRLGGQFRLAGMQPRRQQILDYLDW